MMVEELSNKQLEQIRPASRSCLLNCGVRRCRPSSGWKEVAMRLVFLATALLFIAGQAVSTARAASHFGSITTMFRSLGDFEPEDGTFKIIAKRPLRVQLVDRVVANDFPEAIRENMKRAVIYGVYRTFAHTDVDTVTVSAVPGEFNPPDTKVRRLLEKYRITITASRAHALAHVQQYCPVSSIEALVEDQSYGGSVIADQWIECFEQLQYNDQGGPGLAKFFPGLGE
jgi:hypothetical protein